MVKEKIGRNYSLDYGDAINIIMDSAELLVDFEEEQTTTEDKNIVGFVDLIIANWKVSMPNLPFKDINSELRVNHGWNRFGVLNWKDTAKGFDFMESISGKVIIPREIPVTELCIPKVNFSDNNGERVTPRIISKSLDSVAEAIILEGRDPSFIIGLTHPRMGNLSKRWGFKVETRPFPQEIYKLIDLVFKNEEADMIDIQMLHNLRNQVLIYQTKPEFLERIAELKRALVI